MRLRSSFKSLSLFSCTGAVLLTFSHIAAAYQFTSGTGFYVNRRGYFITNEHVVRDCRQINVVGGVEPSEAKLIGKDATLDLALLKTEERPERIAPLHNNPHLKQGDDVMVIGYPGAYSLSRQHKIVMSEILSADGPNGETHWLQFADSSERGNSGGPLMDTSGNVIGVVTAKLTQLRWDGMPLGTTDLAITMPVLKQFLDRHFVHYDQLFTFAPLSQESLEERATQFILSVHCIH